MAEIASGAVFRELKQSFKGSFRLVKDLATAEKKDLLPPILSPPRKAKVILNPRPVALEPCLHVPQAVCLRETPRRAGQLDPGAGEGVELREGHLAASRLTMWMACCRPRGVAPGLGRP